MTKLLVPQPWQNHECVVKHEPAVPANVTMMHHISQFVASDLRSRKAAGLLHTELLFKTFHLNDEVVAWHHVFLIKIWQNQGHW